MVKFLTEYWVFREARNWTLRPLGPIFKDCILGNSDLNSWILDRIFKCSFNDLMKTGNCYMPLNKKVQWWWFLSIINNPYIIIKNQYRFLVLFDLCYARWMVAPDPLTSGLLLPLFYDKQPTINLHQSMLIQENRRLGAWLACAHYLGQLSDILTSVSCAELCSFVDSKWSIELDDVELPCPTVTSLATGKIIDLALFFKLIL